MEASNSAISGLGISFLPSPPPPAGPVQQLKSNIYSGQQRRPHSQQHHAPSSSQHSEQQHYHAGDAGRGNGQYRVASEAMIRTDSNDSEGGHSGGRRVRIASGNPMVFGRGDGAKAQQHDYLGTQAPLSPFSDLEDTGSSSDDSHAFSPHSMSSLPSSTGSATAYYPQYAARHTIRQSHSMSALPYAPSVSMVASPSRPYPPSIASAHSHTDLPYGSIPSHQSHSSHSSHSSGLAYDRSPSVASTNMHRSPSRLPAFLVERTRKEAQALSRPKSMLELGEMYALQSIEDRSQVPAVVHSRHYGGGVGTERVYTSEHSHDGHDDQRDVRWGDESPESIPSSAGGLHRRQLEKQLQEQHQAHQQELRRVSSNAALPPLPPQPRHDEQDQQQLPAHPTAHRAIAHSRSRSLSTSDARPLPSSLEAEAPRPARPHSELVTMRSFASMRGLEPAETGGSFVTLDVLGQGFEEGEEIDPDATSESMRVGEETVVAEEGADDDDRHESVISVQGHGEGGLQRQSTLLTVGANPLRRSKELDRLLAPTGKKVSAASGLPSIAGSPTPSSTSSAITHGSRARAASHSSSSASHVAAVPVILEQAKSTSKSRVELDLVLESSVVVEGGVMKGKIEVRIRKPKDREREVWVGKPKIRVVGFEELSSQDARHIFYHHASSVTNLPSSNGPPLALPCFASDADPESFHRGRIGQHTIPFSMQLPLGKGAKGGCKGKAGVVRYIVIASVKLKDDRGADRSIAHFYRHVEIFPYFNPAVLLAPALKPLMATASKTMFMGGNGKVNLTAKMHRGTWVAGQRCYVDVNVDNLSSKKIKTLTLSLIRTTTVFRPRPWLHAGSGYDPLIAGDADVDPDACQTSTTRKKMAESTLEMGKKGNKGVTAKGNWMGVDGGENADFSHFLLVPAESLTIIRGRHLEITYAVKVSVGGTLAADVSADIPIRIINFISLDPPPGHCGEATTVLGQQRPLANRWSVDQLSAGVGATHLRANMSRQQGASMGRMASLDSLRLSDLNGGRGPSLYSAPTLSRVGSLDTLRTTAMSSAYGGPAPAPMSRGDSMPTYVDPAHAIGRDKVIVGKAKERQLVHQMSLDCISSAIASATARRGGHSRTGSGLRTEVPETVEEKWEEEGAEEEMYPEHANGGSQVGSNYYGGGGDHLYDQVYDGYLYGDNDEATNVQLDDLDDIPDDAAYRQRGDRHRQVDLADESEDELEAMMGQSNFDEDEPTPFDYSERVISPRVATTPARRSPVPTTTVSRPSSPVKPVLMGPPAVPRSAMKQTKSTEVFGYATPASPVRANIALPPTRGTKLLTPIIQSPVVPPPASPRRVVASTTASRPLPTRPSMTRLGGTTPPIPVAPVVTRAPVLVKKASTSSLKRAPVVLKKVSSRSLRAVVTSPLPSAANSAPPSPSTRPAFGASPRKVVPEARMPTARAVRAVLPSVRSKVQALDTRQAALNRLSGSGGAGAGAGAGGVMRASSITESERSFALDLDIGYDRAGSMGSFRAPLLREREQ